MARIAVHPVRDCRRLPVTFRRRAAFTLIELLVALVVLSTGIVLVLGAFQTSIRGLADVRETIWASQLAREKMAEVHRLADDGNSTALFHNAGRQVTPAGAFTWAWDGKVVEVVPPEIVHTVTPVCLYDVTVTVVKEGGGRVLTVAGKVHTGGPRTKGEVK